MQLSRYIEKLPQAPLQEVIFELRWKLEVDKDSGFTFDPGFQLASGRFDELVSSQLKKYVSLKPPLIPDHIFSSKAIHQYWANEMTYPVMQLGPGLFSVNETEKNYIWKEYKRIVMQGIDWLNRSYRSELNLDFVELRYIDAVEMTDEEAKNIPEFLENNLNIGLINKIDIPGNHLAGVHLSQRFELGNNNYLNLVFSNGVRNIDEAKVIVWHTSVNRSGGTTFQELEDWVEYAHDICSELFRKIINKKLYDKFSKTN